MGRDAIALGGVILSLATVRVALWTLIRFAAAQFLAFRGQLQPENCDPTIAPENRPRRGSARGPGADINQR